MNTDKNLLEDWKRVGGGPEAGYDPVRLYWVLQDVK